MNNFVICSLLTLSFLFSMQVEARGRHSIDKRTLRTYGCDADQRPVVLNGLRDSRELVLAALDYQATDEINVCLNLFRRLTVHPIQKLEFNTLVGKFYDIFFGSNAQPEAIKSITFLPYHYPPSTLSAWTSSITDYFLLSGTFNILRTMLTGPHSPRDIPLFAILQCASHAEPGCEVKTDDTYPM
jgi:hypothetical protein